MTGNDEKAFLIKGEKFVKIRENWKSVRKIKLTNNGSRISIEHGTLKLNFCARRFQRFLT